MGYYVRALKSKRKPGAWKLQFISYSKEHAQGSKAMKPKREWDVPKERWRALGFHSRMSLADARARQRELNLKLHNRRITERRGAAEMSRRDFAARTKAAFSDFHVAEFERRHLRRPYVSPSHRRSLVSGWTVVRKVILAVEPDPSCWLDSSTAFFDYFAERGWSLSYARRLIHLANLWGHFISRKLGRSFLPLPYPRGYERSRLYEAYHRKLGGQSRASAPLTPERLEASRPRLKTAHYNWLYLAVWAGLRPQEIDQLRDPSRWMLKDLPDGRSVLWVYQTKIVARPQWERWKPIPLIFPEQTRIPGMISGGEFVRPTHKVIHACFGKGVGLYGGRKGFTDLMLGRQQPLEFIAQWMGHSSIERTWQSYKDRWRFHYFAPTTGQVSGAWR